MAHDGVRRVSQGVIEIKLLCSLLIGSGYFRAKPFSRVSTPTFRTPVILHTYLPMKMEQCSKMSAYKIQTPENYPEESIQHSEHGESLESRTVLCYMPNFLDIVMLITQSIRTDILGLFF
jgi:hypothetical protein